MRLKKVFLLAVLLRLILLPLFYHPDLKSQHFHFQFLSRGILNIYSFIDTNKGNLPYRDTFNYLPLTYFSFGLLHTGLKPFFPPNLTTWLNDWSAAQYSYPNLPVFIFLLKIPYLFFDLAIAWLLIKLFGKKIGMFWLFNPLSLYLIYVLGNFDVFPALLTLSAYYFLKKQKNFLSFFFLGLATSLKLYPLLFLPFFLFYSAFSFKKFLSSLLSFFLPLVLSIAPFVSSPAFWQSLSGSGLSQKILEMRFLTLPIFPVAYILIFLNFLKHKSFETSCLHLYLAFLVFVPFHPQWLIWFLPFFISLLLKSKIRLTIFFLISFLALTYTVLRNDSFLFWGHLIPIDPDFNFLRTPYEIIRYRFLTNPTLLQNYLKIFILFLSPFLIYSKNEKI